MPVNVYRKDYRTQVSKNFKVNEFSCHGKGCCSSTLIDAELVDILQKIRDHFAKPVHIVSGYRCEKHNKAVGGATKSRHLYGMAADIKVEGVAPLEVAKYAESIGVKGIGLYETSNDGYFVHIDIRDTKAFWYGKNEAYRSTFCDSELIKAWQKAAISDGFLFKSGPDGIWGTECEIVAEKAICKKRLNYKYGNLTKIVQRKVGVAADGRFGNLTKKAVITWQKANGLTADGIVGINSWKSILRVGK